MSNVGLAVNPMARSLGCAANIDQAEQSVWKIVSPDVSRLRSNRAPLFIAQDIGRIDCFT